VNSQRKHKIQIRRRSRKRYYIANKSRFRIVAISLVLITLGVLTGFTKIISAWGSSSFLEASLSQNLNLEDDEQFYKLVLQWPLLEADVYEQIDLIVGEEEVTLSPTVTYYEMNLYEPNTTYDIEFRATRKGIGFSKVEKQTVTTLGTNEVSQQSISNLEFEDGNLSFHHTFHLSENWNFNRVSYELVDLWQDQTFEMEAKLLESNGNIGTFQVTVPLNNFSSSRSLSLQVHLNQGRNSFFTYVTDSEKVINENYNDFTLYVERGQFALINDSVDQYTYSGHHFFAESFHPAIQEQEELLNYQLVDREGNTVVDVEYQSMANLGIDLSELEAGRYYVFLNEKMVRVNEAIHQSWHTVTRNGVANRVTVEGVKGLLALTVTPVTELPDTVYDILIDPGHGGPDGGTEGNGLLEADEALKVSTYLTKRFEEHGLKVKMTRTGDYEPAGNDNFHYRQSPYFEDGRVSQAYQHQVKYVISNHMNALNGNNTEVNGFELYSSIFTTDSWTESIARELVATGHVARDSLKSDGRASAGSFKRSIACTGTKYHQVFGCTETYTDEFYMIRESGGPGTLAAELLTINSNFQADTFNFGAETTLIEYAYFDHADDAKAWVENWEAWGEAVVKATLEHLNIEYKMP